MKKGKPVYCPIEFQPKETDINENIGVTSDAKLVMDLSSNQNMVIDFFEKLEEIGIKFSHKQRKMLTSTTNTMILGRSGTGKTTISAFKIIALDMLFMAYKKRFVQNEKSFKLTLEDFKSMVGCSTAFCTASPVLTNEVKRFYADLINKVKKFIKVREEKRKSKGVKSEDKDEFKATKNDDLQEQAMGKAEHEEGEVQEQVQFKDEVMASLEREKKQLMDDLELEKQLTMYSNLSDIPKSEFPLFLTVKKLVYMLDGDCTYSFFCRDNKGNIYGMDSSSEWHTESKGGALMINQYQKEIVDFDAKIQQLGKAVVVSESDDHSERVKALQEEGIYVDDVQFDAIDNIKDDGLNEFEELNNFQDMGQGTGSHTSLSKMKLEEQMFSSEVTFEIFEKHFWHKNKGGLKLSAVNVWTEIFSVIKGSYISRYDRVKYAGQIVSWERYRWIVCTLKHLNDNERNRVYLIYMRYEKWKRDNHMYDFMDVVRHVFLHYKFEQNKVLDYLVIDEVQDLTPLTIQLLLSIANKNSFLCGDTAQTIAKGVNFRFYDLRRIYSTLSLDQPKVVQLTKNYRSHKQILELANTVVDLIEYFFPSTIDRLKREKSKISGPKPLILDGFDEDNLQLAFMPSSSSAQPKFGSNQVVIVRNQEAKESLPACLQHVLCLTVYEVKGLEFDNVILYNFFADSTIDSKLWRLFYEIELTETQDTKASDKEFQDIDELD